MKPTVPARFTRADYERLPERAPYELIGGQLVREPAPTYGHQFVSGRVYRILASLVGDRRALHHPVDVVVDEENVFQPDVAVFAEEPPFDARGTLMPVLVVEVLSRSTALRDRVRKAGEPLRAGVREVWLVDPATRTIEVRTRAGSAVFGAEETAVSTAVPGFATTPRALLE